MNTLNKLFASCLLIMGAMSMMYSKTPAVTNNPSPDKPTPQPPAPQRQKKVQVAVLLDVSNSMDGLIEQAKAQLWNMVSVLGKAKCEGQAPQIEVALYEYGSPRNDIKQGYVRQISPFTTDLDELSTRL